MYEGIGTPTQFRPLTIMKNSAVPYVSVHYGRVRALIPPRGTCAFRCAHLGGVRAHTGIREAIALQFLARITLIVQPFLRSYVRFCENGRFRSLLSIAYYRRKRYVGDG